jgi:CII-binding regulator of phage lambda lysogenization HflD
LFNFVGKISKALIGTMDDEEAQFYHNQIEHFEQGTTTLTELMKQQLMIVKSTLCAFNKTLTDVEYNEVKLREGLSQLQTYVATFGSNIENTTYFLSLKIALESHIAKALDASHAIQRTLDILVDNIDEAQKGSLPPRLISPALLL